MRFQGHKIRHDIGNWKFLQVKTLAVHNRILRKGSHHSGAYTQGLFWAQRRLLRGCAIFRGRGQGSGGVPRSCLSVSRLVDHLTYRRGSDSHILRVVPISSIQVATTIRFNDKYLVCRRSPRLAFPTLDRVRTIATKPCSYFVCRSSSSRSQQKYQVRRTQVSLSRERVFYRRFVPD